MTESIGLIQVIILLDEKEVLKKPPRRKKLTIDYLEPTRENLARVNQLIAQIYGQDFQITI